MVRSIKKLAVLFVSIFTVTTFVGASVGAAPIDVFPQCTGNAASSEVCKAKSGKLFGPDSVWSRILNAVTYIIGALAVLMIIVGGFRYITSQGDTGKIAEAKNTILYAIVGIVVAISANAIINFVLTNI